MSKLNIHICNSFIDRLFGLSFKTNIKYIYCFPKCNSIHTMFMFKNIDVYMTDKSFKILYIHKNLKPFKVILPKKNVYYTFEVPVKYYNYNIGDYIKKTD